MKRPSRQRKEPAADKREARGRNLCGKKLFPDSIEFGGILGQPGLVYLRDISDECLLPRLHHFVEDDPIGFAVLR